MASALMRYILFVFISGGFDGFEKFFDAISRHTRDTNSLTR